MKKDVELKILFDTILSNATLETIEEIYTDILIRLIERYNNRIKELIKN